MQHTYSIHGIRLEADSAIPALKESTDGAAADVRVWVRDVPEWAVGATKGTKQLRFDSQDSEDQLPATVQVWRYCDSGAYHFYYRDSVEFVIDGRGGKISARWNGSATFEDAASYLVGVILGFALRLSGRVALHASVVAVDEHAIVLLGHAGTGKSTTAAAFATLGYAVLTDDVCVPIEANGSFLVEPAYPGIRLWPDSVNAMFGSDEALPRISPGWDKRLLSLSGGDHHFQSNRLPVAKVYWLTRSDSANCETKISDLRAPELMLKLVETSYPGYLLDGEMKSREFDVLGRLAAKVPAAQVEIHEDLLSVSRVCEAIVKDLRAHNQRQCHS